jgi:hypothetical protein
MDDIERASRHVEEAKELVERQRLRISRLKVSGFATCDAERTLEVMLRNLKTFEDHERRLIELSSSPFEKGPETIK